MDTLDKLKELGVTTLLVANNEATAVNPYPYTSHDKWRKVEEYNSDTPPLPTSGIPDGQVGIENVEPQHQWYSDGLEEWLPIVSNKMYISCVSSGYAVRTALVPKAERLKEQGKELEKIDTSDSHYFDKVRKEIIALKAQELEDAPVEPQPEKPEKTADRLDQAIEDAINQTLVVTNKAGIKYAIKRIKLEFYKRLVQKLYNLRYAEEGLDIGFTLSDYIKEVEDKINSYSK